MARIPTTNRDAPFAIVVDGNELAAFPGETVATVLIAAGHLDFRRDRGGEPRGPYCNMGTCCECMVTLEAANGPARRVRACLIDARPGQRFATR